MGHNRANTPRTLLHAMQAERYAIEDAVRVVLAWNERLADKRAVFFSPTLGAALLSKQHWLSVCCPSCETVADVDLTVVRRPLEMTIREILPSLSCLRCEKAPPPTRVRLHGPVGTRHPVVEPEPREIENARKLADALTEIAHHGVGRDAIRSAHEMMTIAERALDLVGIEWLKEMKQP